MFVLGVWYPRVVSGVAVGVDVLSSVDPKP